MTAYYNENDPKAAVWLRELIAVGEIAPGIVDERDIRDIRPQEITGYTQCHFFAGIGGWSHALRLAGWPDDRPVWTGSCPCQPFSAAGKRGGTADERHLWPHWFHLISECRPATVFGEQVASKDGLGWFDLVHADLDGSGYAVGATDLCAAGVGAPHIRQRLWFVGVADSQRLGHTGLLVGSCQDVVTRRDGERALPGPELGDAVGPLEHATGDGRLEWRAGADGRGAASGRSLGGLADTDHDGSQGRPVTALLGTGRRDEGDATGRRGGSLAVGMADTDGRDARAERERPGSVGWVGDPRGAAGQRDAGSVLAPEAREQGAGKSVDGRLPVGPEHASAGVGGRQPRPTDGFWRDADWLYCRDGKRRPVEPGLKPLAHGVSGRVGLLRGYGNAIVPQVAAAFIEAFDAVAR